MELDLTRMGDALLGKFVRSAIRVLGDQSVRASAVDVQLTVNGSVVPLPAVFSTFGSLVARDNTVLRALVQPEVLEQLSDALSALGMDTTQTAEQLSQAVVELRRRQASVEALLDTVTARRRSSQESLSALRALVQQ